MKNDLKNESSRPAKEVYRELMDFFSPEKYQDVASNGLLIDNTDRIRQVYTATFSGTDVIDKLKKVNANHALLFTHHPGPQHEEGKSGNGFTDDDYEFMIKNHISHFNLHLPLDQVNPYSPGICLAKQLGAVPYKIFFEEGGATMGLICTGTWETSEQVLKVVQEKVGHSCKLYAYGNHKLLDGKIAISAGGAEGTELYDELKAEGVKLFLTGVGSPEIEWFHPSHAVAQQQEISILSAGHYSTEKFALIDMCRFFIERGLPAEFIEESPHLTDL